MLKSFFGFLHLESGAIMIAAWNAAYHGIHSLIVIIFFFVVLWVKNQAEKSVGRFPRSLGRFKEREMEELEALAQVGLGVLISVGLAWFLYNAGVVVMALFCVKGVEKRKSSYIMPLLILYGISMVVSGVEFVVMFVFLPLVWIYAFFQAAFQIYFFIILLSMKQRCKETLGTVYEVRPRNHEEYAVDFV